MWAIQDAQYKKEHMHEFDANGIHKKTGTEFDKDWFNREWYDCIGFNRSWTNSFWYDIKWKNTEPFYDYDVEQRKEFKSQAEQEKRQLEKSRNREVDRLENKLSRLRREYRKIKHNTYLPKQKRDELLAKICDEAAQNKKLIASHKR